MYTIYTSNNGNTKSIMTVEFWNTAIEVVENLIKHGDSNNQVWVEDKNGKVYTA
jgi:hypothetical protein